MPTVEFSQPADTASSPTSSNTLAGLLPSPASASSTRVSRDACRWPKVLMRSKPTSPGSDVRRPRSAPASCAPRRNSPTPASSRSIGATSSGWPPGGSSATRSTRLPVRMSARKLTRPLHRRSTPSATLCRVKAAQRAALSPPEAAKRARAAPAMKNASFGAATSRLGQCARKRTSCLGRWNSGWGRWASPGWM